jgi:hypothetical protein
MLVLMVVENRNYKLGRIIVIPMSKKKSKIWFKSYKKGQAGRHTNIPQRHLSLHKKKSRLKITVSAVRLFLSLQLTEIKLGRQ